MAILRAITTRVSAMDSAVAPDRSASPMRDKEDRNGSSDVGKAVDVVDFKKVVPS